MKSIILFFCIGIILFSETDSFSQTNKPNIIVKATYFDKMGHVKDMPKIKPGNKRSESINIFSHHQKRNKQWKLPNGKDPVLQKKTKSSSINPIVINKFDGNNITDGGGSVPSDVQGDVGDEYYMQIVNCAFSIYNKNTGAKLYGPQANTALFNKSGDIWYDNNDGDGVILYDEQAGRWLATQFAVDIYVGNSYKQYLLIAISETSNPLGKWNRWGFEWPILVDGEIPDYPKWGIWRDGYYCTVNASKNDLIVFDRNALLAGMPDARMLTFTIPNKVVGPSFSCLLPADCDGNFPPAGTPCILAGISHHNWVGAPANDCIQMWNVALNWNSPQNSVITNLPDIHISAFDYDFGDSWENIKQYGTTQKLDAISEILMYRLNYRDFGNYQAMVCCHTVDVDNTDHAGIRWYELRNYGSGWTKYQEATYSPDAYSRWNGSIALDAFGNIALGYTVSGSTIYPSIRFTGRRAIDPLNQMTLTETEVASGVYFQSGTERWGDYSMMSVDPATKHFWLTNEYIGNLSGDWFTKIVSFTFALSVNTLEKKVNSKAGQTNFDVSSIHAWTAASDQSWCVVTSSGSGDASIVVDFQENSSFVERTAKITLASENSSSIILNLIQAAKLYVACTNQTQNVSYHSGQTLFNISSNTSWIVACDKSWCIVTSSGTANSSIVANFQANPDNKQRTAVITVSATDVSPIVLNVVQEANALSIDDLKNKGILVFPNPSNGIFTISVDNGANKPINVKVSDIAGKTVYLKTFSDASKNTIDIGKSKNGCYILELLYNNQLLKSQIIVQ